MAELSTDGDGDGDEDGDTSAASSAATRSTARIKGAGGGGDVRRCGGGRFSPIDGILVALMAGALRDHTHH